MTYYQLFKKEAESTSYVTTTNITKEEIDRILQETFHTHKKEEPKEEMVKEKIEFPEKTFQSIRNYFSQQIGKKFSLLSTIEPLFKEEGFVTIEKAYERFVIVERKTEEGERLHFAIHYGSLLSGDDVIYDA